MNTQNRRSRWLRFGLLAGLAWAVGVTPVSAQALTPSLAGGLGGSSGGSGGGGGGGGGGSSSGTAFSGSLGSSSTGSRTGGSGSATVPTSMNPLYSYYGGPFAAGLGQNNALSPNNNLSSSSTGGTNGVSNFQLMQSLTKTIGSPAFGMPLYGTTGAGGRTLGTTGGALGGTAGRTVMGFSTYGMRRSPAFITVVSEDLKPGPFSSQVPPPTEMLATLRGHLDRSSSLKAPQNIQVSLNEGVIVLQGTVSTPRERRLAEALVRLQPGIHDVDNRIAVNSARPR